MTHLVRSFRYDAWANRRTLGALRNAPQLEERSRQVMAHLLMAQKVWLKRIRGEGASGLRIWPDLTLEECVSLLEENAGNYERLLGSLPAERLGEVVSYRNSTGAEFRTALADILTQVLLHGSYHRGQLATAIKRQGGAPPATDYIVFVRES